MPACGLEEIYSVSVSPEFSPTFFFIWTVSTSSFNFEVYGKDLKDVLPRTITVTSTLVNSTTESSPNQLTAAFSFTLNTVAPVVVYEPPYFEQELETQVFETQC